MVGSLKLLGVAGSFFVGVASAFTTLTPLPTAGLSHTLTSKRQSPSSLQASRTITSGPFDKIGSPAVLDRPSVKETKRKTPADAFEGDFVPDEWLVRIYNDGVNTREYVARCLVQVVGLCEERAFHTMMAAHNYGIATVGQWHYERAEMYYDKLGSNGIKCDLIPASDCN